MSCSVFINGNPADTIDCNDRGLQYGDGVFETIAVSQGQPEFLHRHLNRLQAGCCRLGLPFYQLSELLSEINALCSNRDSGVIKIQISSGSGARGYARTPGLIPNRIVSIKPSPEHSPSLQQHGIRLKLCRHRLSINPSLAGIKHLNRLDQVLARSEWSHQDYHEGVMMDADGYVTEGVMSNLFYVKNGQLKTALLDRAGVSGIIRSVVMDYAALNGMTCKEQRIVIDDLVQADELFMTNSVIGIWPVRQFETRRLTLGPVTVKARQWVNNAFDRYSQ
ncbi:MAG: aminodeoxychorismate lyase [Gammaproteobacteria bacterium]|nr:aminodeoxychorismate lyase [Gammaproteobacteria bacterium]